MFTYDDLFIAAVLHEGEPPAGCIFYRDHVVGYVRDNDRKDPQAGFFDIEIVTPGGKKRLLPLYLPRGETPETLEAALDNFPDGDKDPVVAAVYLKVREGIRAYGKMQGIKLPEEPETDIEIKDFPPYRLPPAPGRDI